MSSKMLIDASHPEETRVVVVRGNRIEEFDFESEHKKQIRGNIYLARVTRVEPSLQAAFVEYGGNRHGFLAFSEIHPDYYQIPFADRQALLEAEAAEEDDEDDEDEQPQRRERGRDRDRSRGEQSAKPENGSAQDVTDEPVQPDASHSDGGHDDDNHADDADGKVMEMSVDPDEISEDAPESGDSSSDTNSDKPRRDRNRRNNRRGRDRKPTSARSDDDGAGSDDEHGDDDLQVEEQEVIESVGAEDAMEEVPMRKRLARRQYKIQEVIKRRQVLLVQVVKEERGNKGAALTTYLSLAGRYSVLMPNTGRGGGISRKITSAQDRKRLKDVVKELEVPKGMGVILRTAGANRTKVEIKRDYEYLMRAWETVRSLTLQSSAPALVYEEGSLIKRSIRDLYNKDIGEIMVAGEGGYREAKDFMRMLMPSHAKMVQPYRDPTPIFARAGIEAQLDRMLQPQVTLKSGGYIIINQTEALVSIDVNSGRSTREHSIEDTALQTNLEAAEEVARQLRLRDLAGLVVIDFIDMEEKRNNRAVEKRLKDNLKNDRARIQVGRISHFGLLEMSRQRIRASVLESTMQVCAHCGGTGHVRSQSSVSLHVIRTIEENLLRSATHDLIARTSVATALYVLNHKRAVISDLEAQFGLNISIEADDKVGAQHIVVERGAVATGTPRGPLVPIYDSSEEDAADELLAAAAFEDEVEVEEEADVEVVTEVTKVEKPQNGDKADNDQRRKRRRRRRGRNRNGDELRANENGSETESEAGDDDSDNDETATVSTEADGVAAAEPTGDEDESDADHKKRRRGKRGGRRNREGETAVETTILDGQSEVTAEVEVSEAAAEPITEEVVEAEKPKAKPRGRKKKVDAEAPIVADVAVEAVPVAVETPTEEAPAPKRRATRRVAAVVEAEVAAEPVAPVAEPEAEKPDENAPRKGGWWQRKGFF